MATSMEYIEFVCAQIQGIGAVRYRKMFGEYMVYVNEKPILIVCDNTVFIKMLPEIKKEMEEAETGYPYEGAKEHYILDIDNAAFSKRIVSFAEMVTPLPRPKKKRNKNDAANDIRNPE